MLQAAVSLFILGIIAFVLGAYNIAGISMELGRMLLIVFVILSVISFFGNFFSKSRTTRDKSLQ